MREQRETFQVFPAYGHQSKLQLRTRALIQSLPWWMRERTSTIGLSTRSAKACFCQDLSARSAEVRVPPVSWSTNRVAWLSTVSSRGGHADARFGSRGQSGWAAARVANFKNPNVGA